MREFPAGDDAVIFDYTGAADPAAAAARAARVLTAAAAAGQVSLADVVPAGHSVLVQAEPGNGLDVATVRRIADQPAGAASPDGPARSGAAVTIPVHYDGADLGEIAGRSGMDVSEVVTAHTALSWRVQFMGFAPGFGYLVPVAGPAPARTLFGTLPRRSQSRPDVPAGAVAAAAGYSAVYPRNSPGGWFLLGHTVIPLWNVEARPPALLAAGTTVRFVCAD